MTEYENPPLEVDLDTAPPPGETAVPKDEETLDKADASPMCDCFCPGFQRSTGSSLPNNQDKELSAHDFDVKAAAKNAEDDDKDALDSVFEPVEAMVCGEDKKDEPVETSASINNKDIKRDNSLMDAVIDDDDEEANNSLAESQVSEWNAMKQRVVNKRGAVELDSSVHSTEVADVSMTDEEKEELRQQEESKQQRRKMILLVLIALLLLIATVLGLVFGLRARNRRNNDTEETIIPRTVAVQSRCSDATAIPANQAFSKTDSTTSQTALNGAATIPTCGDVLLNGYGKWFTMVGDNQVYTASTCNGNDLDTQISIFEGSCDTLQCVAGNDNAPGCGEQSQVSWFAAADITYNIFVHGYRENKGTFTLDVAPMAINHEECSGASVLEAKSSSTTFGSTFGVTIEDTQEQLGKTCSRGSPFTNEPGMWYQWQGNGDTVTISTCSTRTDYDALITVLRGENCNDLKCIPQQDRGICGSGDKKGETVRFVTEENEMYSILIHKAIASDIADLQDDQTFTGNFELFIQTNDDYLTSNTYATCSNSQEIMELSTSPVEGKIVSGMLAPVNALDIECTSTSLSGDRQQKWHKIMGTGGTLTASTCNADTSFDTQLTVLGMGGTDKNKVCEKLQCVAGNDNHDADASCGYKSSVSWLSVKDQPYFVVVHAFGSRSGTYSLTIEEEAAA